jgi:hypothetical protein
MAVGYKRTFTPPDDLRAVQNTSSAITFDLELGLLVLIVADAPPAGGARSQGYIL